MTRWTLVLALAGACGFHAGNAPSDGSAGDGGSTGSDAGSDTGSGSGSGSGSNMLPGTARRKPIVIQGSKVAGSLTGFQMWVSLTDTDLAARAQASGSDIFFTNDSGSAINYEIESWAHTTGDLRAWVRVGALDPTGATIYVEYGDVTKATPPDPTGVFGSNYLAVWHLDDALSNTTIADASGNSPGTATGLAPSDVVAGQLGNGIAFDGTGTQMIQFTNLLAGTENATFSAWVKQNTTNHTSAIVVVGTPAEDNARFLYGYAGNGSGSGFGVGQYMDDWYPAGEDIENAGWTMLVWTSEGTNKKNHLYKNGAEIPGSYQMLSSAPETTGTAGYLGFAPENQYGTSTGLNGAIDEVRIEDVERGSAWISTEYANQSSPSTFYTVGAEEDAP
ncbi:MAG TPA: DUF2341 domain-containing protein [Kofleriaceae bacterium]|jgi:hypothetical protein